MTIQRKCQKTMKRNRMRLSRIKQSGFTLLEIIVVLAIAALLITAVMRMYQTSVVAQETEEWLTELTFIQDAMISISQNQPDYGWIGSDCAQVIARTGFIPLKYLTGVSGGVYSTADGLKTPFSSPIRIAPSGQSSNGYYVAIWGIPASACVRFLSGSYGPTVADINVDEAVFLKPDEITPKIVTQWCSTSGTHFMAWDFHS